ncbi:FAD-binding domain-containing protein, partial [Gordonia rubripertincta]
IHPRTLAADLGKGDGPQAYLRELAFRDFYADVLFHWPHSLWHNWNRQFDDIELDTDDAAYERFEAWKSGRTGFPLVDAGMRQLAETGWMHNRVRMVTASFLVKDLHLPWWWGAEWFLDQLVDGDMASNNHGWQWAAGTGTDAAPYFRVFNPEAQAKKFDPKGEYVRRWVGDVDADDYPEPIVDHKAEREEALRRFGAI